MQVIVVYDVPAKRIRTYRKLLRRRLEHLQYSAFFGEFTAGQVTAMKNEIESELEPTDPIVAFEFDDPHAFDHTMFGDADEPGNRFTWTKAPP